MNSHHFTPGVYRATCVYVHSACLCDFFVDLGFNNFAQLRIRLTGVEEEKNPQTKAERVKKDAAKQLATQMLRPPSIQDMVSLRVWPCELRNLKPDGADSTRWCAEVWVFNGRDEDHPTCLNKVLIDSELVEEEQPL